MMEFLCKKVPKLKQPYELQHVEDCEHVLKNMEIIKLLI